MGGGDMGGGDMGGGDMGGHFTLVPVYSIFYLYCLFIFSSDERFLWSQFQA